MPTFKDFFASASWQKLRDLALPQNEAVVGGVCAALSRATPLAAWMWRALFCTTALLWGGGVVAYAILWISIPTKAE